MFILYLTYLFFISIIGENWRSNSWTAGTTYDQEAQVILLWFKFLQMSSYQKIKIFIVNKKNVNQGVMFVFFDKYMYWEIKSLYFSAINFRYYAYFYCREVNSNKYNYCAISVQSFSAYATIDR